MVCAVCVTALHIAIIPQPLDSSHFQKSIPHDDVSHSSMDSPNENAGVRSNSLLFSSLNAFVGRGKRVSLIWKTLHICTPRGETLFQYLSLGTAT
jgi:hypothetical protein